MSNYIESNVIIPQGMRKYLNTTQGKLSLSNNVLKIQSSEGSTILVTPLSQIKKAKIQMGILYIYTSEGMKEVSFKVDKETPDEAVDTEAAKWQSAFTAAGVKSTQISLVKSLVVATIILVIIAIYKILTIILNK